MNMAAKRPALAQSARLSPEPEAAESDVFLEIRDVCKRFGDFSALADISLTIERGSFVCFLGPSGCGKTTLLRSIAGLERQSSGRIVQDGRDISNLPPSQRDFGIVFQSYSLFPNLTVNANVGYGLVNQGLPKAEIATRVQELLELVHLPTSGRKYPAALSGGEQQRVALARALAMQPGLLLLDEPLSALDAKVRVDLRHEMKDLQRRLGVTTVMVTHDQEEALALADIVVVMSKGKIEQVGTPMEVYSRPQSAFVADFVGHMNLLRGRIGKDGSVRIGEQALSLDTAQVPDRTGEVLVSFRPEDVVFRGVEETAENRFLGYVESIDFLGSFSRARVRVDGFEGEAFDADLSANILRDFGISEGSTLPFSLPRDRLCVYPGDERTAGGRAQPVAEAGA
ncbi:Fe(3+) ions import ATP-binding protein FbpC [Stappia taiwanensis]|nr:putative 2-aminoethylphosphonate ABC transporter ATP-binding protein [Stappia taiwanensis]GGF05951.1 Fe(3+) ions import ATP-binding protein FbpC [Stappia taiwanensis]